MKRWKRPLATLALVIGMGTVLAPAPGASAIEIINQGCKGNNDSTVCKSKDDNVADMMEIVINTLFLVLGMIAVLMIVIGGIRYASSGGDAGAVKSAKDTILYSVVGLVVAVMAYTIVNFVAGWF